VCDCNYLACVIATRDYVRLQEKMKPGIVCAWKATWLLAWVVTGCK
jgi:hypothetical protein